MIKRQFDKTMFRFAKGRFVYAKVPFQLDLDFISDGLLIRRFLKQGRLYLQVSVAH